MAAHTVSHDDQRGRLAVITGIIQKRVEECVFLIVARPVDLVARYFERQSQESKPYGQPRSHEKALCET